MKTQLRFLLFLILLWQAPIFGADPVNPPTVAGFSILDDSDPALSGHLPRAGRFGRDFNPLGDLDLDGVPDFLVGARSDDDGATDAGAVYVLFMNTNGSVRAFTKISALSGGLTQAGVTLSASQLFGYAVASVGDLDGDGIQDIAVGANNGGPTPDGGIIYILFLNRDGTVRTHQKINSTEGNLGHTLDTGDLFGTSATFLGNVNGAPALAVTAAADDDGGTQRGALYLLRLATNGTALPGTVKISSTSGGFGTGLANRDQFGGRDVTPLGDLDGDGHLDLAVAAFGTDDGRGAVWILHLNADLTVKSKQKIAQGSGGLQASLNPDDNFGHSLTGPGDLDGDGIPDLITSANRSDAGGTDIGELYYLFLNADGTVKAEARVSATQNTLPFTLPAGGRFGRAMAMLGDLAGNGTMTLAVSGGAGNTGTIYLLFLQPLFQPAPRSTFAEWTASHGLSGAPANADGDNDGVSLLEEYAFNLNPLQADRLILDSAPAGSGLPNIRFLSNRFQIEYLRRVDDPDLSYQVESSNAVTGGFTPLSTAETASPVSASHERITVTDPATSSDQPHRFLRIRIVLQ